MPSNQTRKQLLDRIKTSSFPGSIIDVFKAADQGVDLISQFEQEQQQQQQQQQMQQGQGMQVANTPEEQEVGLREQHAMGNTGASMAFPDVEPNQSFNTMGMKAPINIEKVNDQGHLVESYKNVPPGIQDLPTGPYKGTIIESPAGYQKGGVKEYHAGGLYHNINHKKKSGTSRSKSNSTISTKNYSNMKSGFKNQRGGVRNYQKAGQKEDDVYQGMDNIYQGANFMRRWQLSDRYNDLVTKEIKKDQKGNGPFSDWSVDEFNRYRNANLMSNGTFDYSFDISGKDNNRGNMTSASTNPTTGKITFYRPKTEEGTQFVGKIPTLGSTMAHEKTHQRDRGFFKTSMQKGSKMTMPFNISPGWDKDFKIPFLVPQSSVNLIDNYLTLNKDFDEGQKVPGNTFGIPLESADPTKYDYLTDKNIRYDEIIARVNAIRHEIDKYGLFDVFNEEVTEENYNLILEHFEKFGDKSSGLFGEYGKSGSSLRDLQQLFQDKQIRDLLNTVSDKGDPSGVDFIGEDLNENTKVVKKGGLRKLNKRKPRMYQTGGGKDTYFGQGSTAAERSKWTKEDYDRYNKAINEINMRGSELRFTQQVHEVEQRKFNKAFLEAQKEILGEEYPKYTEKDFAIMDTPRSEDMVLKHRDLLKTRKENIKKAGVEYSPRTFYGKDPITGSSLQYGEDERDDAVYSDGTKVKYYSLSEARTPIKHKQINFDVSQIRKAPDTLEKVKIPCEVSGTCKEPVKIRKKFKWPWDNKVSNKGTSTRNLVNGRNNTSPSLYGHYRNQRKVISKQRPLDFLNPFVIGGTSVDKKGRKKGRFLGLFKEGGVKKLKKRRPRIY